jgi:hypothetical protein
MTKTPEIEKLLSELPDEVLPQVTDFLRTLVRRSAKSRPTPRSRGHASRAVRSFGMIPAKPSLVHRLLAEDLYDLG